MGRRMTELKHPVPDPRQRQAWLRHFKKLRQQQERQPKPEEKKP